MGKYTKWQEGLKEPDSKLTKKSLPFEETFWLKYWEMIKLLL